MSARESEMDKVERLPLGIVVERREIDNPWEDHVWAPVAVFAGAPEIDEWRVMERGEGWIRYHAGTLSLELFRGETEAYKVNLSEEVPSIYVLLRDTSDDDDDPEFEVEPFLATVSPYEAQDYLDAGDEIVDPVTMPDGIIAWVQAFIDAHHEDEPFKKRRLRNHKEEREVFVRRPENIPVSRPVRRDG